MNIDTQAKRLIAFKRERQQKLDNDIIDIIDQFMGSGEGQWYHIDTFWECPDSPFGWCAYHFIKDPAHDGCIYCHQPQERK
jgi:hypothetical protein